MILWVKFPDEVLQSTVFDAAGRDKLEAIFSTDTTSAWSHALAALGLPPVAAQLLYWHNGTPYFNQSAMMAVVSGGAMEVVASDGAGYAVQTRYTPQNIWRLIKAQFSIARFLGQSFTGDPLVESIALGIVLQSLVMQLGKDALNLAALMANPPPRHRKTVAQIQQVQLRRTALSHAWHAIFPAKPSTEAIATLEYFWDKPIDILPAAIVTVSNPSTWQGQPVTMGQVTGVAVVVLSVSNPPDFAAIKARYQAPLILIFKRARPETTEVFSHGAALLFANGGVLSHACTIAREMNIPCVTALGDNFYESMQAQHGQWLTVDATAATVKKTH